MAPVFRSSCTVRLAPLKAFPYNGNPKHRMPLKTDESNALQQDPEGDGTMTVNPKAYPDDLLRDVVQACLSVRDLADEEALVVRLAGTAALMAMHRRAIRKHGYKDKDSANERAFVFDEDGSFDDSLLQFHSTIAALYSDIKKFEDNQRVIREEAAAATEQAVTTPDLD